MSNKTASKAFGTSMNMKNILLGAAPLADLSSCSYEEESPTIAVTATATAAASPVAHFYLIIGTCNSSP